MRILLDTHVFIWAVTDSRRLNDRARETILAADEAYVSAASIWEIGIKARIGKIEADPVLMGNAIEESGFFALAISPSHAAAASRLPAHHNDPFDRMLVAQAVSEPLLLLTGDALLGRYSELVRLI